MQTIIRMSGDQASQIYLNHYITIFTCTRLRIDYSPYKSYIPTPKLSLAVVQ